MTIDTEKIKQAIDHFEEEDFVSSKEIIQQEIKNAKNSFLQNKLGISSYDNAVDAQGTDGSIPEE